MFKQFTLTNNTQNIYKTSSDACIRPESLYIYFRQTKKKFNNTKKLNALLHLFLFFFLLSFFSVAYLNLGTSLIALGRCQEAANVLRDGSRLDGTGLRDRTAHDNARIASLLQLGGLYAEQGKLQRALAVYREALHNLPDTYPPQVSNIFV